VSPFLQALWLNSATATISLIVCTSQADPQVKQLALQLGVCAYINKPFDLHLLTDPIAAQLHQKDLSLDSGTEETSPTSNPNGNSIAKTDSTKISGTSLAWGYFTAMVGA
jgi:DNA-binding response OmpR family regulator